MLSRRLFAFAALFLLTSAASAESRRISVPDVALLDQDGRQVHLYSDLIKDRTVVMNFIFTSCSTVCSPMGANFAALQKKLGPRSDVRLISVSIDPATDTPARLKRWSRRFGARAGWTLLTGERSEIDRLLKALGADSVDRFQHTPLILVGSGRSGQWSRASGLAAPAVIAGMIEQLNTAAAAAGAQ